MAKKQSQKKIKNLLKVRKKGISFYRSLKSKEIKHLESKCKKYHFIFFMLESGYGSGKWFLYALRPRGTTRCGCTARAYPIHAPPLPTPFPYKYNKNKCRFSYGRGFFSAKPVTLKRLSSELSIDEKNKTLS